MIAGMRPGLIQLEIGVQSTNDVNNTGNPPDHGFRKTKSSRETDTGTGQHPSSI